MFDVKQAVNGNESYSKSLLKFMNLENLDFDELKDVLNSHPNTSSGSETPTEVVHIWTHVAKLDLGGEFSPFIYVQAEHWRDDSIYLNGDTPILYDEFYRWASDNFTVIEYNGGEGEGDSASIVIQHDASQRFLRINGSYQSYNGFEWGYATWMEVKPRQVTTTEYY